MTFQEETLSLIKEHGVQLSLVRKTGGSVDPVTGIRAIQTETTYKPYGIPVTDKFAIQGTFGTIEGSDKVFMIDTTIEPENGDKVTLNGQTLAVKQFHIQHFEGTAMYYTIMLAK